MEEPVPMSITLFIFTMNVDESIGDNLIYLVFEDIKTVATFAT
jgi:hypothetical protein